MPGLLVYSEAPETALELVSASRKLGSFHISVALLGSGDLSSATKTLSVSGVSTICIGSDKSLEEFQAEAVVDALEAISKESSPDVILIGGSRRGKEVAPRLATRLKIGCLSDALKVEAQGQRIFADRLVWGGNAVATIASKAGAVVTIPPRTHDRASGSSNPEIKRIQFSPRTKGARFVQKKEKSSGQVDIKQAEAVVSAGRGFKRKEDLAILKDLALVLNAVIGASRPLTSDLGWMPEDSQVGLSGVTVKPKLYVAVGISGQIQHLTGMRDSKLVVAINNDRNAPIFQECDYGIVGDLYQVVPELVKALKARLGR